MNTIQDLKFTQMCVQQVLQLLRSGGNDSEMEETWNKIGDYFTERHKWDEAVQYYEKARNTEQVKRRMMTHSAFLQQPKNTLPTL